MNLGRSSPLHRVRTLLPPLLGALALLAAAPALARAAAPMWSGLHPVTWSPARLATPPVAAAMRVAIDPETGRLGLPSAEQLERLRAAQPSSATSLPPALVERRMPDGSYMVDLRDQFMSDFVVVMGADGRLRVACTDEARAHDLVRTPPASPASAAWPEE